MLTGVRRLRPEKLLGMGLHVQGEIATERIAKRKVEPPLIKLREPFLRDYVRRVLTSGPILRDFALWKQGRSRPKH